MVVNLTYKHRTKPLPKLAKQLPEVDYFPCGVGGGGAVLLTLPGSDAFRHTALQGFRGCFPTFCSLPRSCSITGSVPSFLLSISPPPCPAIALLSRSTSPYPAHGFHLPAHLLPTSRLPAVGPVALQGVSLLPLGMAPALLLPRHPPALASSSSP